MQNLYLKKLKNHIHFLPIVLLSIVDIVFIIKYISRVTDYVLVFVFGYIVIKIFFYYYILSVKSIKNQWIFFYGILAYVLLLQIGTIVSIDPMLVGVDRWDCIIFWWDAIFDGTFPYASRTRFGGFFSPYPFYELLYFPFYFLRDIGWANLFFLVAFLYYLKRLKLDSKQLLITITTIAFSMPFWWEICIRSTLLLNSFMILFLAILILNSTKNDIKSSIIFGLLSGFFLSSRMVLIMPIIMIISYKYLKNWDIKNSIIFTVSLVFAFILTFLPLYFVWGYEAFVQNNPFKHHNNHMPIAFTFLYLISSILIGYYTKDKQKLLLYMALILWTMGLFFISWAVYKHGLQKAYFDGKGSGDISYFIISFALLVYCTTKKEIKNA